jgi:CRP-like cAMP-binding protein
VGKREQEALARVPLFSHLSRRSLRRVADLAEEVRFMEGARVVKEGDPGDAFYAILEGQAKAVDRRGRTVNRLLPGDFFGEIALLDGGPRTATVVAETPLLVLEIRRKGFLRLLAEDPSITVKLLEHAAAMLRRLERPLSA